MVKPSSGIESPVDMAFNDIFEVIQEMETPSAAQIVPGRDTDTPDIYKSSNKLGEARIYDSDVSVLVGIKAEPNDVKVPCMHPSQFSEWVNMSIHADKARNTDQLFQPDFSAIKYIEDTEWGERLINETKNLFQFPSSVIPRDIAHDRPETDRNYNSFQLQGEPYLSPEFEQSSWYEQPFMEDDLFLAAKFEPSEDLQDDSSAYFSENSSDSESTKKDDIDERISEQAPSPWLNSFTIQSTHNKDPVRTRPDTKKQTVKRYQKSFKSSGRPRLCQFLLELLNDPEKYSNLIEWLDKDKGVFKFLNSSRVAQEWGTRRNKPRMKYENFARSLRTYIAKGILTKPRSKLVYRFSSL